MNEEIQEKFSVYQFFKNDIAQCVARFISAEEAMNKALFYSNNVAANCGITQRVIITDYLDCINWEWQFGKGVIFPTKEDCEK